MLCLVVTSAQRTIKFLQAFYEELNDLNARRNEPPLQVTMRPNVTLEMLSAHFSRPY